MTDLNIPTSSSFKQTIIIKFTIFPPQLIGVLSVWIETHDVLIVEGYACGRATPLSIQVTPTFSRLWIDSLNLSVT